MAQAIDVDRRRILQAGVALVAAAAAPKARAEAASFGPLKQICDYPGVAVAAGPRWTKWIPAC
jgi:hypothetical protein